MIMADVAPPDEAHMTQVELIRLVLIKNAVCYGCAEERLGPPPAGAHEVLPEACEVMIQTDITMKSHDFSRKKVFREEGRYTGESVSKKVRQRRQEEFYVLPHV